MPIFEYECKKCRNRFEFLQFRKDEKVNCPQCNSSRVSRLFSTFGYLSGADESSKNTIDSKCGTCSSRSCATCK